jgi:hypothetical protein
MDDNNKEKINNNLENKNEENEKNIKNNNENNSTNNIIITEEPKNAENNLEPLKNFEINSKKKKKNEKKKVKKKLKNLKF